MNAPMEQLLSLPPRFFGGIDQHRYEDVAALMARDGEWHRQGKVLQGGDQVLEAMHNRMPGLASAHIITNLAIEHGGAAATLTFNSIVFAHVGEGAPPFPLGGAAQIARYTAHCVEEDGAWKIARMTSEILFKAENV